MREGWEINSIITLESPQFWGPMDEGTDAAGIGPLPVSPPANSPIRWSFYGKTSDFKSEKGVGIPYFSNSSTTPPMPASCQSQALAVDGGTPWSVDNISEYVWLLREWQFRHASAAARPVRKHGPEHVRGHRLQEFRFLPGQEFPLWRNHAAASAALSSSTFSTIRTSPIHMAVRMDSG